MQTEQPTYRRREFHLLELIGEGAFGEVYLAEQDSGAGFRRRVALKVLHPKQDGAEEAARRMRDEARLLGRLSHRNIVTVLDLVRLGDRWAIVMDFVPGADLQQVVKHLGKQKRGVPLPAILEIGAAVADAIEAAFHSDDGTGNQLKVIHRDLKPANIRATSDGDIKVLDFGIASMSLETREAETGRFIMGTELYMAPERMLAEDAGPPGDVYALAATLFELAVGKAFGRTPVLPDRHERHLTARIEVLKSKLDMADAAAVAFVDLLRRALHDDPTERPTTLEFEETCRTLARTAQGETLRPFCRSIVAEVETTLGASRRPASGVLSESSATLAHALEQEEQAETTVVRSGRPVVFGALLAGAAVVGLVAVLAVAVALIGVTLVDGSDPVVDAEPSATESEPAEPTVPEPVETTVREPAEPTVPEVEAAPGEPVAPEPESTSVAQPAATQPAATQPAATQPAATQPAATQPAATEPAPEPEVAKPVPTGPRIDRAKVSLNDASELRVKCGDVKATGTASVLIQKFPAGSCAVEATYLGARYRGTVTIDRARGVKCSVSDGQLLCQ